MDLWITPRLGEIFSNTAALVLCAYLAASYFGAAAIDKLGFASHANLAQVRRAFLTRKYRGRPVVPVGTYASMKKAAEDRINSEKNYYIIVAFVTMVVCVFSLVQTSSAIVRLYQQFQYNPFVFFGTAAKLAFLLFRLTRSNITIASGLTLIAFSWSGVVVRLLLCCVLIAGHSLPIDSAAKFSYAFFAPFRFWTGTATFKDGSTQEVEFVGAADPFYNPLTSFMSGLNADWPDVECATSYGFTTDEAGNVIPGKRGVTRKDNDSQRVGDYLDAISPTLNDNVSPNDPVMFLDSPVGREQGPPLARYTATVRDHFVGTEDQVKAKFGITQVGQPVGISVDYVWLEVGVRFHTIIVNAIGRNDHGELFSVHIKGAMDLNEMNFGWYRKTQDTIINVYGYMLKAGFLCGFEGVFDSDIVNTRMSTSALPLGFAMVFMVISDVIEILIGSVSAYTSALAAVKWFKGPDKADDVTPEAKISCATCAGPHMTAFCSRNKGVWHWISWALNGTLILGAALVACLLTAKGFSAIKNIARGLKHGLAYVMDYKADVLHIRSYTPVKPLFPAEPDMCPWLNALLELNSMDPAYECKKGIFNAISFNLLVTTLKANLQHVVDELEFVFQHAGSHTGGKIRRDRLTLCADKCAQLGLRMFAPTNAVTEFCYYSVPEDWNFVLSAALPGFNMCSVMYKCKTTDEGTAVHHLSCNPVVVPSANALFTPPADPETSFVDLFVMGWSGACAVGLPLGIYYLMKKFFDRNAPGTPCSVCLKTERDHFDGQCADFPVCPKCSTKTHRPGNCSALEVATAPSDAIASEGKKEAKRICRFSQTACADVNGPDCPFTHRDFSVVSKQSITAAAHRGAKVVCLHHDRDTPCILKTCAAIVDRAALKVTCVDVPIDGKARPTGSVSVPPADIYFTPISVYEPALMLLNLRSIESEGKNDKMNFHYSNSARSLAHREDSRANNRRDNTKFHGSDDSHFFEFVSQDHEPVEWMDYVEKHRDQLRISKQDINELESDLMTASSRGQRQRVTIDFIHKAATGALRSQVDKYMSFEEESLRSEAKPSAPPVDYCHDFANFRCSRGQACKYQHVPYKNIPLERRMCCYGQDKTACPFNRCVFHYGTPVAPEAFSSDRPPAILSRRSEAQIAAEAVVRNNPLITMPSVTPLEVSYQTSEACCSLYAWKLSDNNGAACFLAPYHLFGKDMPKPGTALTVMFTSTTPASSMVTLDCVFIQTTSQEPFGSNAWKTAMCVFSCKMFPQKYFPNVKTLSVVSNVVRTPTQVVLYPAFPGVGAAGLASPIPDGSLLSHTISMPETVNNTPVVRCGRLIVSSVGILGFHVAGDALAGVNYAYPIDRIVHLLSGCIVQPTTIMGQIEEQGNNDRFKYICRLLDLHYKPVLSCAPVSQPPLDVMGNPSGHCYVVGTCKVVPQSDSGFIFDIDFFFFMREVVRRGQYPNITSAYIQHCSINYLQLPQEVQEWLDTVAFVPEAIYGTEKMFTHIPAQVPTETVLEQSVLKFFRRSDVNQNELSAYFKVLFKPFFDTAHRDRPYVYLSYNDAVLDMEQRGNEYRSAGAGVTKNEAFRDPSFRTYVESFGDFIPVTCYVVSNKKELRTIGKTMRQFMVQDAVSYVKEVRWLRWFMDQIIHESLTGEYGACFFNTFSPFEGPASLADRAASRLNCNVSDLWFWCFDASKSECNEFQYILRELAQLAVEYGAPFAEVMDSVLSNLNPYFFDLNTGNVYKPKSDCTMSNASGAFHTTILTALLWGLATGTAASTISDQHFRACIENAGDDGVLCCNGDPRPRITKFLEVVARFGGKIEFEESPYAFSSMPPNSFNFCSVTCSTLDAPYTVVGKKTSALAWKLYRSSPADRMQGLDSYWLTSYYDVHLRDFLDEYRRFYACRTGAKPHYFRDADVRRMYKKTYGDAPIGFARLSLDAEAALSGVDDKSFARCLLLEVWNVFSEEVLESYQYLRSGGASVYDSLDFCLAESRGLTSSPYSRWCPSCGAPPCEFCDQFMHHTACCAYDQAGTSNTGCDCVFEAQSSPIPRPLWAVCGVCDELVCGVCYGHTLEACESGRYCICRWPSSDESDSSESDLGDSPRSWSSSVGSFSSLSDFDDSDSDSDCAIAVVVPQLGIAQEHLDCGREDRSIHSKFSPAYSMSFIKGATAGIAKPVPAPRARRPEPQVQSVPINLEVLGTTRKRKDRTTRNKARGGFNAKVAKGENKVMNRLRKVDRLYTQNRATTSKPTFGSGDANARKMARIVACPDELENYDLENLRVPVLPSASSSRRHTHAAATMITTQMRNKALIVQAPGQTTWAARILNTASYGSSFNVGDILVLNPAREDFCWLNSDSRTGAITAASTVVYSKKLTAGLHSGIMLGCDTEVPPGPVPVQYTATSGTAYNGVYCMVTDGAGNYNLARQPGVSRFCTMIIGDVTMVTSAGGGTANTIHPVSAFSFVPKRSGGATTALYVQALPLTTGAIARSALCAEGSSEGPVGDASFFPYTPVCSNLRVISDASALKNKYAVTSFALSSGREGPFNSVVAMGAGTTTSGILATPEELSQRARQQTIGSLNPDNDDWCSCNLASRISGMHDDEPPGVFDAAFIGVTEPPNEVGTYAYAPAQGGDSAFQFANNTSSDFVHYTMSYTYFNNGDTAASATCPIQMLGRSLFEFSLPSDTGFMTNAPQYCAEFHSLLQTIGTYPTLATAHSFKDFLGGVWKRTKDVARSMVGKAGAILKPMAVHAGTELVRSLPELILAA